LFFRLRIALHSKTSREKDELLRRVSLFLRKSDCVSSGSNLLISAAVKQLQAITCIFFFLSSHLACRSRRHGRELQLDRRCPRKEEEGKQLLQLQFQQLWKGQRILFVFFLVLQWQIDAERVVQLDQAQNTSSHNPELTQASPDGTIIQYQLTSTIESLSYYMLVVQIHTCCIIADKQHLILISELSTQAIGISKNSSHTVF
jgi:hypothetical protein